MPNALRVIAIGLVCCCLAATAAAQDGKSEAEREALVYSAQAKSAYAGQRWDEAARMFMKAYSRVPEPTLVYNAARAYQKAGRGKEALPLFRLYLNLEHAEDAAAQSGRQEAAQHIKEIEAELRATAHKDASDRRKLEAKAANPGGGAAPPNAPPPANPWPPPNSTNSSGASAGGGATTGPGSGGVTRPGEGGAAMTPTGRKVVHRPDLFQRVSRIGQPSGWSPQEKRAVTIGAVGAGALLIGLTLHAIETDLEALDDSAAGKPVITAGRTFYPGVTQREVDDALGSNNAASYIGNSLIFGGLVAGGVAVWMWSTAPHGVAINVTPTRGGGAFVVSGRF